MGLRKVLGVLVVLVAMFGSAFALAAPFCEGSAARAAHCDWDGDGIANKDDPDDDDDGCPDEEDADKWDASVGCNGGEPPPPDPLEELIAMVCEQAPDAPVCDGGGGDPPTPDEIVAAICEAAPDAPVCSEPPPPPSPDDVIAAVCEQAPDLPVCAA